MSFTILTDTSSNLPTSVLEKYGIKAVPFSYFVEGREEMCCDTRTFDGAKYYTDIEKGILVTTSQIPPQRFTDFMDPVLASGNDVLYIGMSSGISGAYQSSLMAAEEMREKYPDRRIEVFDTYSASLAEGNLVILAENARRNGDDMDTVLEKLSEWRSRTCQVFTVDSLIHLRRSGRISNAAAIIGTVLQIKPLLKGNETGQIIVFGKERGRKAALKALAEKYNQLVTGEKEQTVCIAHANAPAEAEYLEELLREKKPPREILSVMYEPVTGSHVGPGAVALFFMGDTDVRSK